MKSPSIARWAEEEVSWLKCVLLCTFSERWASKLSTTNCPLLSRPQNRRQPQGDAYAVPGVRWPSLSFWVMEGSLCLGPFILDEHGLWVSDYPGMWRELANRLLVWFPQDVAKKTELRLMYR